MSFAIAGTTGSGTVSVIAGSRNVTGSGAAFNAGTLVGRIFYVAGGQWGIVQSVTDTATLTLDRPFVSGVSGVTWGHAATNAAITQSGTDTSLAGLATTPGVTVITFGNAVSNFLNPRRVYDLGGLTLTITGSLSQDANYEELYFGTSTVGGCILINSGGSYLPTTARNMNIAGLTAVRTYQTAVSVNRNIVGTFNLPNNYVISASAGSTFSPTGVIIKASLNVLLNGNGTCTDSYIIGGGNATPLVTYNSNTYVINGLYIVGTQGLVFTANNQGSVSGLVVRSSNGTSQHDGTGWTSAALCPRPTVLTDYVSVGSTDANFRDFGYWWNGGYRIVNSGTGSRIISRSNTSATDPVNKVYGNGFTIVTRNVGFTLSSPGTPVTSGVIFMRDTNNGSRRSLAAAGFSNATLTASVPDYSQDITYLWQANSSGMAAIQNVTTAVNTCDLVGFADPRTGNWDYRSKNGQNTDLFDFAVWSYGHLLGDISNQSLVGSGNLNVPWTLFNDTYVSLTETNAVAKLASSFTVDRTTNTITVTANSTLDDLYDALKAYKTRPIQAQLEYPSIKVQPVNASGTDASTTMNIVVNSGVILSAGTKLKTFTTTGTVTNNGSIRCLYTSNIGPSAKVVITNPSGANIAIVNNSGTIVDFATNVSSTYTYYIPPGMSGNWQWIAERYGYKRLSGVFTPGSGGEFANLAIWLEDTSVTETDPTVVAAYTVLDTPNKVLDFAFYYRTTQDGILYDIISKSGSNVSFGSADATFTAVAMGGMVVIGTGPFRYDTLSNDFTIYTGATHSPSTLSGYTSTGVLELFGNVNFTCNILGGTFKLPESGTYAFGITSAIIRLNTYFAGETYNLRGCNMSGTISLKNDTANAVTVQVPNSATITTAGNTGGTITVDNTVPVTITAANLLTGSRVRLYNVTDDEEMYNGVLSSAGLTFNYSWSANKTVTMTATYQSGTTAKLPVKATGVVTSSGLSFLDTQEDDLVYNALGIDGQTITGFNADYITTDVVVTSGANFTMADLYAWWVHNTTTADGVRFFVGGLTAIDLANFRIDVSIVDIKLDNSTSTSIYQTDNRRIYRSDGAYPVLTPTTGGGGIDVNWRDQVLLVQSDDIAAIKKNTDLIPGLF